ncbi:MAG TPA: PAS domain S-box protein [Terriglobia bacterium]|nr:PAS domain S-box protein [Terriglobia bacterium]
MAKRILACLRKLRLLPVGMVLAWWCVTVFAQARQADTQVRLPMVDGTDLRFARSRRDVTYTALPPGDYVFRVQGSNNRGVWNEKGVSLRIQILPPWWGTWWFRSVCAVVFLLLLWAAYQFRVHQLQRESKKLRDVIDTIPGYVWSALPDGSVDFMNRRGLEFSGVPLEDALGRGWEAAFHPDDLARFLHEWRAAVACGKAMESEARLRRADGQYRWLLIRNVPLHDQRGKIVKWYGTSHDIDDRKRAEKSLREQANLLDLTHDTIFVVDMQGVIKYWNRGAEEQYGWTAEQSVGTVVHDLLRTVFPVPRDEIIAEVIRTARWEGELVHTRKDGTQVVVSSRLALQSDEQGAPVAILATSNDITERKRAEEALQASEGYLAEAQRLSLTGSWAFDLASNKYTYSSEECNRILELGELQDWPTRQAISRQIHPEDWDRVNESFEKSLREKVDTSSEFRIVLPSGTVKHIQVIRHPVLNDAGDVVKLVGTLIDMTERKRAEEERERLRQLEADLAHFNRVSMIGELAASIAHEVNQPIAAAITSANACLRWLAHDPPDLERARAAVGRIEKEGNRAAEVIQRLRSFYKKGAPPRRELLDMNEVAREMLELLRPEAGRRSVSLRTELAELPKVLADRVQLQQVFMNLMLNGIEAMEEVGGELTLKSELGPDGQLLLSVSDTGIGLPAEKADQMFDAFFTTKPQGSGMGLAICRSIIESHGGRLWATANSGRGATFHFTLPPEIEAQA